MTIGRTLRELFRWLEEFPYPSFILVCTVVFDSLYDVFWPLALSWMIDLAVGPHNGGLLLLISSLMATGWTLSVGVQVSRDWLIAWLSSHILGTMRTRLEANLHKIPFSEVRGKRPSDLLGLYTSDLAHIENLFVNVLPSILFAPLYLLLSLAAMAYTDVRLTALVALGLPLTLIGTSLFSKRASKRGQITRAAENDVSAHALETLEAQALIRTFGLRDSFQKAFRKKLVFLNKGSLSFYFLSGLTRRTPYLWVQGLHLALILGGTYLAFQRELGIGALLAFNLLFLNVTKAVLDFSLTLGPLIQSGLAFERIEEGLAPHSVNEEVALASSNGVSVVPLEKKVVMRGIAFRFSERHSVLEGLDFTIPAKKRTAVVGPSGSGKTTLASLLAGLYVPDSGSILWDGVELGPENRATFTRSLGIVFQENPIFNTSLRGNVLVGLSEEEAEETTDEALWEALEDAGLAEWVRELPQGLDTPAGEGGGFLSGGQRQRLALARALIRRPTLLLLDEATSALDPLTERHVNDTLKSLSKKTTIVHITHRLEGITDYDQIVVLKDGKASEQGTHTELVKNSAGVYASLWKRQSGLVFSAETQSAHITSEGLRAIPLFASSSEKTLEKLVPSFLSETLEPGKKVIRQGDPGSRFFVIARGRVDVSIAGPKGEQVVATLSDGDFFGEMSLLDSVLTSATVTARLPTILLALEKTTFLTLMKDDPKLFQSVSAIAAKRKAENAQRE